MFSMLSRRRFLEIATATAAVSSLPLGAALQKDVAKATGSPLQRSWLIHVDPRLGSEGDAYRSRIEAAAPANPLLKSFGAGSPPLPPHRFGLQPCGVDRPAG